MIYIFVLFLIFLNEIIIKYNFFSDRFELSNHKLFVNKKKVPNSGGIFLIIFIFFFNYDIGYLGLSLLFLILLIGLISDRVKNFSPIYRLFLQIIVCLFFIHSTQTLIYDVRINELNNFLQQNIFLSSVFTVFCFIVLINGSNFIDGINLNAIGYYIIVYSLIFLISTHNNLNLDFDLHKDILILLSIIYILNFHNKIQLGDSGAYLLSFFTAFYLIQFVNLNQLVSPYFVVLLLWYPCFENLFSIFRKIFQKTNVSKADNFHLHHKIFTVLKKYNYKKINNLTGIILNLSNLFTIIFGYIYFNSTKILIIIIVINIFIYIASYNILEKIINSSNSKLRKK